jgi:tetratricopeptide (TPR) repeat protein
MPILLSALMGTALLPGEGEAQEQERFTNLQVLPSDMSRGRLMSVMRDFTRDLGVRCSTCHVGEEGQPLSTYDFASDDKAAKLKAREMMRMVRTINDTYLAELPGRRGPGVAVTCLTCHRGVSRPEAIDAVIGRLVAEEDVDFAIERYRALRDRYYGSAAYDFTEGPLLGLANRLAEGGDRDSAMRILALNLEYDPQSAPTMFAMARLHEDLGQVQEAIELYRKGLEIMPGNRQARLRLEALTGG